MTVFSTMSGLINAFAFCFCAHPIHVSVTEIEFDEKEKTLEIIMRVFIDDLELSLRNSLEKPELDILSLDQGTTDALAGEYLKEHFRISLDNKPERTRYLGHERESDAFIFYIEVTNVKEWKTITIHNDIIIATHDDQSNIVHVYVKDKVKSIRLTRNTPADNLTFD